MSDESGIRQFRLFGEDAPGWFVWGLALFGLAGFVATAQLSLPVLEKEYIPQYFARFAASEGNQGQSRPILLSDTKILVNPGPTEDREPVPGSNKSTAEDSVSLPTGRDETEPDSMPLDAIAVSSPDTAVTDSPAPQDSPPSSDVLVEPLGPMPDLLAELRLPPPVPEASAHEENLEESFESDSAHDQEGTPDVTPRRQPTSGGELESDGDTLISDRATPVSDGEAEKATVVAVSPDQANSRPDDCAPVFLVTFSSGGVEPVESDLASKVRRLADWLRRHPAAKVYLEGHTDGVGHEEFNLVLSHRRAKAVADLLVQAGVPAAQLSTRAYGESMLADPQPRSGRNRRVSMRTMNGNDCLPAAEDKEG